MLKETHLFIIGCLFFFTVNSKADDVPTPECDLHHLIQNFSAVKHAYREANATPPKDFDLADKDQDAFEIQKKLDSFVVAVVTVNPESRVKVMGGPASVEYRFGWPNPTLVKVINEGGVTARLHVQASGDPATKASFYEQVSSAGQKDQLTCKLSGQSVEYQVLLIQSAATGKREIKLTFDVGQATQDLGFRAELPLLLRDDQTKELLPFLIDKQDLMWKPGLGHKLQPVKEVADWIIRANCIKENVQAVTGSIRLQNDRDKLDLQVESEVSAGKVTQRKISFLTPDGDRVPAYVLLPKERIAKLPAILCLHQTTKIGKSEPAGLGGLPNLHYARELAERGYVTLAPDYPGYGDYGSSNPYQLIYASATAKGIVNHRCAIEVLSSMNEVDPERIGCIGHSLGGHNTLFVSLFDSRIKAMATSCGFCSFPKYYGGNLKGWSHKGYMPRIANVYQCDPQRMPFDFTEVLGAMAPRPVFINAPIKDDNFNVDGVKDCVKAALPVYKLYGKPGHLVVEHPDCGHDFPLEVRQRCYAFFDQHLSRAK